MNQNNNENNPGAGPKVSLGTKLGYLGTGVLVGLIIYPFVRKTLSKVQPKFDALFDDLTGKAEDLAERASDLIAKARTNVLDEEKDKTKSESHSHDH